MHTNVRLFMTSIGWEIQNWWAIKTNTILNILEISNIPPNFQNYLLKSCREKSLFSVYVFHEKKESSEEIQG